MRPASRLRASELFDQQMWCWGRDVRHEGGDALVRFGFSRWRVPRDATGSNAYTLDLGTGRRLTLWAFGLCHGDGPHGSIFLKRFEFDPRWRPESTLPGPTWSLDGLPAFHVAGDEEGRRRVRRLMFGALEMIASYEEWAFATLGAAYRRQCVEAWFKRRTLAGRIASRWRCLARRFRETA